MVAKRKKTSKTPAYKRIEVGRFDSTDGLKPLVFADGEVVKDALDKAGLTLSTGEECVDINGEHLSLNDKLKPGMSIIVTGNYKSGSY